MTRHRTLVALALALSLAVLAAPAAAQGADTSGTRISFQAPPTVGEFRLIGHEVLEEPGAGAHMRYERPGQPAWIDVYVYPVAADSGCTAGCDSLAVRREAGDFTGMIPELLRRGYYDSLRVVSDQRMSLGAAAKPLYARHLALRGGREGQGVTSQFYLVAAGEVLVKVRATYPPDPSLDGALEAFARGFVEAALGTVNACPGGEPMNEGYGLGIPLASPPAAVRPRVKAALERLGYALEPDTRPDTFVTLPVREWPARDVWDRVRTHRHPGVQVMVELRAEGSGTEMRVSARTLCGMRENRDVETAVTLIAAGEVTMEFPEARK